jgi:hypothetical protein
MHAMSVTRGARGAGRFLLRALVALLSLLILAEIALQVASFFVGSRAGKSPLRAHRILCVGDSHTYGAGIPASDSYPAALQSILDERAPGAYSVINLGVPGMNTAQVLRRLPQYVRLYRPETVVAWVGINNAWNRADMDLRESGWGARLDGLATRSRLYRLIRTKINDRKLERTFTAGQVVNPSPAGPQAYPLERLDGDVALNRGGRLENIHHVRGAFRMDRTTRETARRDFETMAAYLGAAGIRMILITYPFDYGYGGGANEAIRAAAKRRRLGVVESPAAAGRIPPAKRKFIWAAHPTGPIYREVARDVADRVFAKDGAAARAAR